LQQPPKKKAHGEPIDVPEKLGGLSSTLVSWPGSEPLDKKFQSIDERSQHQAGSCTGSFVRQLVRWAGLPTIDRDTNGPYSINGRLELVLRPRATRSSHKPLPAHGLLLSVEARSGERSSRVPDLGYSLRQHELFRLSSTGRAFHPSHPLPGASQLWPSIQCPGRGMVNGLQRASKRGQMEMLVDETSRSSQLACGCMLHPTLGRTTSMTASRLHLQPSTRHLSSPCWPAWAAISRSRPAGKRKVTRTAAR